jgi:hypothetical protein
VTSTVIERSAPWRPVLVEPDRTQAVELVRVIADRLRALPASDLDHSLATGAAGLALTFAHLAHVLGDPRDAQAAERYLDLAIGQASAYPRAAGLSLGAGLTGVGWVEAHLDRLSGAIPAQDSDVDAVLLELLSGRRWPGPWELLTGLVGFGVYALERTGPHAAECLSLVLDHLADAGGTHQQWVTDATVLFGQDHGGRPARYVDLGPAHGVAGLVSMCSAAADAGATQALPLLSAATDWLLVHELSPEHPTRFPAMVSPGERPIGSRLAWCYGDAGVAAALVGAARWLKAPMVNDGAARAVAATANRPFGTSGITDLGLCHGTAGVVHVLHRLATATADEAATRSARRWARRLLHSAAGGALPETVGFLEGQAGVVLALLAAATPVEPSWDRTLLLSSRNVQVLRNGHP